MATNDSTDTDDTVLVVPAAQSRVYHTNPDCVSVKKAESTREIPAADADKWHYSECGNCNREFNHDTDADRSIYIAACKS